MLLGDYTTALQYCEQAIPCVDPEQKHLALTIRLQQARSLMNLAGREPEALDVLKLCTPMIPQHKNPVSAAIVIQRETALCKQVLVCRQVGAIMWMMFVEEG